MAPIADPTPASITPSEAESAPAAVSVAVPEQVIPAEASPAAPVIPSALEAPAPVAEDEYVPAASPTNVPRTINAVISENQAENDLGVSIRKYSKDFMLKFKPHCMERPRDMPDIDALMEEKKPNPRTGYGISPGNRDLLKNSPAIDKLGRIAARCFPIFV